jgi:hypothetical protein
METKKIVITECMECGQRFENHFYASPCCNSIILKVNELGERTSITFLSTLAKSNNKMQNISLAALKI